MSVDNINKVVTTQLGVNLPPGLQIIYKQPCAEARILSQGCGGNNNNLDHKNKQVSTCF